MTISATTQGLRQGVCTSSNRPVTPFEGQMIYETDTDLTYVYGGSAWQQVSGGTAVGNSGLVYVTSATVGTGVSSVTISSAFSSTYDNYRIVWAGGYGSASTGIALRVGGSSASYAHVLFWATLGVATANCDTSASTSQCNYMGGFTTTSGALACDIANPFISTLTTGFISGAYISADFGTCQGRHNIAQSNTSVTVLPMAGTTITGGTITVYGYRK